MANRRYPGFLKGGRDEAAAWVLDELAAEDSRNSLEGLGLIRVVPVLFNEGFCDAKVQKIIARSVAQIASGELSWLEEEDYVLFCKVCLESLRERNVIEVPVGVDELRLNHEKRGNRVVMGGDVGSVKGDIVRFAGSSKGFPENKRSMFIRKYAHRKYGAKVTRSEAFEILQSIFTFLGQYLDGYFRNERYLIGNKSSFLLNRDIWSIYSSQESSVLYRCDSCGCESSLDTKGVCLTSRCTGRMKCMTFVEAYGKDRFYKDVYQEEALPISIEEHTASFLLRGHVLFRRIFSKGTLTSLVVRPRLNLVLTLVI